MDPLSAVSAFNRFCSRRVDALNAAVLGADLTPPEARLLFEIAQTDGAPASELRRRLDMDGASVRRVLSRFERNGWIEGNHSGEDARRRPIRLTSEGRARFERIDQRQRQEVERMIGALSPSAQADLVAAFGAVRALLDPRGDVRTEIRSFRPGDLGMIAARQSRMYAQDYGWGVGLETDIAESAARFLKRFNPAREQCCIAEVNGWMAGSVMLTDEGEDRARLRLLYVEPAARGLGLGAALVSTCVGFARDRGYKAVTLWTHTVLVSARRLYAAHGFKVIDVHVHALFGPEIQSETWRLDL